MGGIRIFNFIVARNLDVLLIGRQLTRYTKDLLLIVECLELEDLERLQVKKSDGPERPS